MFKAVKSFAKRMCVTLMTVLIFMMLPLTVLAESNTQDRLTAELLADKSGYAAGDTVDITLNVTNANTLAVDNVRIDIVLPEGLLLKSGTTSFSLGTLTGGQTVTQHVFATVALPKNVPMTDDTTGLFLWIGLLLASVGGLIALLVFKKKRATKTLSLLLGMTLAASFILPGIGVSAVIVQRNFIVRVPVTVSGANKNITATVTYDWEDGTVPVTGVTVAPATADIVVGGTQQLTASIVPVDATNTNVTWTSNNTAVATVNASGLVTGVAVGSATITATTVNGAFTASCAVTVSKQNLGALQNVKIEQGVLKWDALPNASGYQVKVGTNTYSISTTGPLEKDIYALNMPLGTAVTVSVQALGNARYNDSAIVSISYTEKMIRDLGQYANFNYNYASPDDDWIQDFLDFSLKESLTFSMPSPTALSNATQLYTAYMTGDDATKKAAALEIGSDLLVTYYYKDANGIPQYLDTTTVNTPLLKNKLWDGWLWVYDAPTTKYVVLTGATLAPGVNTTIGASVPAGTPLRVSSNIARTPLRTSTVPDVITSYDLEKIAGKTLYIQVDAIYVNGTDVRYYTETAELAIRAFPAQ